MGNVYTMKIFNSLSGVLRSIKILSLKMIINQILARFDHPLFAENVVISIFWNFSMIIIMAKSKLVLMLIVISDYSTFSMKLLTYWNSVDFHFRSVDP